MLHYFNTHFLNLASDISVSTLLTVALVNTSQPYLFCFLCLKSLGNKSYLKSINSHDYEENDTFAGL